MEQIKVKIRIAGSDITFITDDDPKYVHDLGKAVDADLSEIFRSNPTISTTQATILLAMDYADEKKKSGDAVAALRSQIKDYLDDASNAKAKADFARREAEKAKKELEALKAQNESLKAQLDEVLKKIQNG